VIVQANVNIVVTAEFEFYFLKHSKLYVANDSLFVIYCHMQFFNQNLKHCFDEIYSIFDDKIILFFQSQPFFFKYFLEPFLQL